MKTKFSYLRLFKSLSKDELGYLKRYSFGSGKLTDNVYLKLLNETQKLIRKKNLNEEKIEIQLATKFDRVNTHGVTYAFIKNQLQEIILKELFDKNKTKKVSEIERHYQASVILANKELFEDALRRINKCIALCHKYNLNQNLNTYLQHKIAIIIPISEFDKLIETSTMLTQEAADNYQLSKIDLASRMLTEHSRKNGSYLKLQSDFGKEKFREIEAAVNEIDLKQIIHFKTRESHLWLSTNMNFVKGELPDFVLIESFIEELESDIQKDNNKDNNISIRLISYWSYMIFIYSLHYAQIPLISKYFIRFNSVLYENNAYDDYYKFQYHAHGRTYYCLVTNQLELLYESAPQIEKYLTIHSNKLNKHNVCSFVVYIVLGFFMLGEYKKCQHWLLTLQKFNSTSIRGYLTFAHLMETLIHFEQKDFIYLEYKIRTFYRYLLQISQPDKLEILLVKVLRKIPTENSKKAQEGFFKVCQLSYNKLASSEGNSALSGHFDFSIYIKSKLNGASLRKLFVESQPIAQAKKANQN